MPKYTIGTRGSLLALTQCTQIKNKLEELTGDEFELKVIKTQGDQITDKPLWQLDGKDFFTKELDEALLNRSVDLVVHSYKDLGSERPKGIKLAAVTKRDFAHDILLVSKETLLNKKSGDDFIVGTSSPRRIENIESFLAQYLPFEASKVETKMLRGNVNTRIEKLRSGDYDAIVLALPGIERLALSADSKEKLIPLLDGLDFMVLPQSQFPSASSQGALGIECHEENTELLEKLKCVQDQDTLEEVQIERKHFQEYGGGCHLAVGINAKKLPSGEMLLFKRGISNNQKISVATLLGNENKRKNQKVFLGFPASKNFDFQNVVYDELIEKKPLTIENIEGDLLVSSSYACDALKNKKGYRSLFASGTRTMKKLAKNGHWVNGCTDGLGSLEMDRLKSSEVLKILLGGEINIKNLTNKDSKNNIGEIVEAYEKNEKEVSLEYENSLRDCEMFYWTSFDQYKRFTQKYDFIVNKQHACSLGSTYEQFKENNISVMKFYGMLDLKKFMNEEK